MMPSSVGVGGTARISSLRREWSRAFTIMLVLLLAAGVFTIVAVRVLVDDIGGTAHQLDRQSETVAALRTALVGHEEVAHKLLSDQPVDRAAFLTAQQNIAAQFAAAEAVFPANSDMRATVEQAARSWQQGLTAYGLWGTQLANLRGNHATENPLFGTSSDSTVALLGGLEGPSLAAMNRGLAHGVTLEHELILALSALFALALAVTVYFRRRMARDLVRPMATLHSGVLRLQAGEYDHRIEVARHDELGELAAAFNGMAGALHDSHRDLTQRATHDSLTGLLNRASLIERLSSSFTPGSDRRARQESVLFIDVDDFKDVNDSFGHAGGDAVLVQLATRLAGCVRPNDMVARLGGDEFAIIVAEDDSGSAAVTVAERVMDAVRAPFVFGDQPLTVAVSIGVAQRSPDTGDPAELLRHADFAMYMAKGGGKDRFQLFDADLHDSMVDRSDLRNDLAAAVSAGQLRLDYQPGVDLRTGEIVGVEALVRWAHPTLGLLAPAAFIPLAEETGDIDSIGCWVLDTAARQVTSWASTLPRCDQLWVSVNLSPFQLSRPDNLAAMRAILTDPAAQPDRVILEVTETALAADIDGGIAALRTLKNLGLRIAIDDFGTGFSSLSTLARLPIDILKIDRSFVSGDEPTARSVPLLEGILGLAHKLSLTVIAEGIEQPDQLDLLRDLGCPMGQGYLLGHPLPVAELEPLLTAGGVPAITRALPA